MTQKDSIPLVFSALLHAGLIALMVLNLSFASERRVLPPKPPVIQASLVKMESQAPTKPATEQPELKASPKPAPEPQPQPPVKPKPDPAPPRPDLDQQRKAEQEKLEEQKRRQAEEEKRLALEKQKAAEAKRKAEAEKKKKAEEERRRKAEEARKQKAAAERKRQAERERQELERAMAAEEQRLAAQREGELAAKAGDRIRTLIERSWSRPPSARTGMVTTLQIQLMSSGQLVDVRVIKSSGNAEYDQSAINAVRRVGQFPLPDDMTPSVFNQNFKSFVLEFNPQDLRL